MELLNVYKSHVASIYPDFGSIPLPDEIYIGGIKPLRSIAFGIRKKKSSWVIAREYKSIVNSILLREAYLTIFPRNMQRLEPIVNYATILAHERTSRARERKEFFDAWLAKHKDLYPNLRDYSRAPILLREIAKLGESGLAETHAVIIRIKESGQRVFGDGYSLRFDPLRFQSKILRRRGDPTPAEMEIYYQWTKLFHERLFDPISKDDILQRCASSPVFGSSKLECKKAMRIVVTNIARIFHYKSGLIGKRFFKVFFTINNPELEKHVKDIFLFPYSAGRMEVHAGALIPGGPSHAYSIVYDGYEAFITEIKRFYQKLSKTGFLKIGWAQTVDAGKLTVNYNAYDPKTGKFVFPAVRDLDNLIIAQENNYWQGGDGRLLDHITTANAYQFRNFLTRLVSIYTFDDRIDSIISSLASAASITRATARRWLQLCTDMEFVMPDPRCCTLLLYAARALNQLHVFSAEGLDTEITSHLLFHGQFKGESIAGTNLTPSHLLYAPNERTQQLVRFIQKKSPDVRILLGGHEVSLGAGYASFLPGFDGESYFDPVGILDPFYNGIVNLARKIQSFDEFKTRVINPANLLMLKINNQIRQGDN